MIFTRRYRPKKILFMLWMNSASNTTAKTMVTTRMELLPVVDATVLKKQLYSKSVFSGVVRPDSEIINQDIICLGQVRSYFSETPPILHGISLKQVLEKRWV